MYDKKLIFHSYTAAMNACSILAVSGIKSSVRKTAVPDKGCIYILETADRNRAAGILEDRGADFSYYPDQKQ